MIRNAIDHGLETVEDRRRAGKPDEGTVTLFAEHRGGRIVIEVRDDGRGINRERVRAKALEKGLIAESANLSNEEVDNLIFLPGFSTAKEVSNISGRGVGMDVVRRNVQELGGRVVISSEPGKGSCFSLTLPLTLAVLDGMVVSVGDQVFVVPLTHVVESLQPKPEDVRPFVGGKTLLHIRNTHVPLVRTSEILGINPVSVDPTKGVIILVESERAGTLGLVVDAILGQRQVVIKSFESNHERIDGIAAATIFGDGRVALILDIDGLVGRQIANSDRPAAGWAKTA
jgi:two-component system chemotaxis sensor kinase CheA